MTENFKCPECESDKIKFRFKVNYTADVYAGVTEEIQCANCFMDIPSNLFIIDKSINIQDNRKMWKTVYKPAHLKRAAQCSKCELYYWEIEKKLFKKNITSSNIFYQTYDTKGSGGIMICRLCDPEAFKKNK